MTSMKNIKRVVMTSMKNIKRVVIGNIGAVWCYLKTGIVILI